jgi:hypothetical protein
MRCRDANKSKAAAEIIHPNKLGYLKSVPAFSSEFSTDWPLIKISGHSDNGQAIVAKLALMHLL